jgi:hypothetical protein
MDSKWDIQVLDEMPFPINESHMLEYVPFILGSGKPNEPMSGPLPKITVSEAWWNALPDSLRTLWKSKYTVAPMKKIPASKTSIMDTQVFKDILKDYVEFFSLERFKAEFDMVSLAIPAEDKANLAVLCRRAVVFKTMPKRWNEDLNPNFVKKLEQLLEPYKKGSGAFVKTSLKSGNYASKPTPCFTVQDVFTNLFFSNNVLKLLESDQPVTLFFRKFHKEMNRDFEFSLFVFEGKIKAISQQHFEQPLKISDKKIKQTISRIEEWFSKWIETHSDLRECVLEVSVLPSEVILLEIQPGGAWNESTSALYTWKEIVKAPVPYFRLFGSLIADEPEPVTQEAEAPAAEENNEEQESAKQEDENKAPEEYNQAEAVPEAQPEANSAASDTQSESNPVEPESNASAPVTEEAPTVA